MIAELTIDAIADAIASKVAHKLRTSREFYVSRVELPPGISDRTFRSQCARIPDAYRQGRRWYCPVDAWHAHHKTHHSAQLESQDAYEAAVRKPGTR
jgi:hypothetical protein